MRHSRLMAALFSPKASRSTIAEKDGSNPRVISVFPHFVYNPAVSPDGQKIRVTVSRDFSTRTIWEVGFDGKVLIP